MNRENFNTARMFIGPEVEHTPAFSKKTLFVVGKQPVKDILEAAREHKVAHIFMGANHSFSVDPNDTTFYWDKTITELLDRGYWVTLDYQAHEHRSVLLMLNKGIWQSRIFVPMLSVRIPNVQTSSPNLTVKIDDVDFKATNPGVWCLNHHEITDSNRFTDWVEYGTDVVIEEKSSVLQVDLGNLTKEETKNVVNQVRKEFEDKNLQDIGLDPNSPSMLKPDPNLEEIVPRPSITPTDALNAYVEGAVTAEVKKTKGGKK